MAMNELYNRDSKLASLLVTKHETLLGEYPDGRAVTVRSPEPDVWVLTDYLWMTSGDWVTKSSFRITGQMYENLVREVNK